MPDFLLLNGQVFGSGSYPGRFILSGTGIRRWWAFVLQDCPADKSLPGSLDYAHAFFTLMQPSKSMEYANRGSGLRSAECRVAA